MDSAFHVSNKTLVLTTEQSETPSILLCKKPATTMLTYPWKCTVLHCNHLGNTWVSRCFPGGYNVKLYISRSRLAWWLLAFLCCDSRFKSKYVQEHHKLFVNFSHNENPGAFPDESLYEAMNYCRNPTNGLAPWCYTMDRYTQWEFCDVPMCPPPPPGEWNINIRRTLSTHTI